MTESTIRPVTDPQIIRQKSNKNLDLSGHKTNLAGEKAAIRVLTRLFAMPGLAGDALRFLLKTAKSANVPADDEALYLLFLIANAEVRSRKLRTP